MKKIILILFAVFCSLTARAQEFQAFEFPPEPFIGTWQAVDGDMTYTIIIFSRVVNFSKVFYGNILQYRLIYSKNGTTIRDTKVPEDTYSVNGRIKTQSMVDFGITDFVLKYDRRIIFTINDDTATWEMRLGTREPLMTGRTGTPDIPTNLTFTKISNETDYDSGENERPISTDPPPFGGNDNQIDKVVP